MSEVADGTSALVHPERSLEGVMERLLALRAQIDAILARLPGPSADSSPAQAVAAGNSEETDALLAGASADNRETLAQAWETARPAAAVQPRVEPMARDLDQVEQDQPSLASNIHASAAAADSAERMELAVAPRAEAAVAAQAQETVTVCEEATGSAPEPDWIEQRQSEVGARMRAAGAALAIAHETVGDATISTFLEGRQHKHKSADTTAPAPPRSGRQLAAKIAAVILVLLTAASVMMLADRTAFGGAPPLACMAPAPPATLPGGLERLWQRLRTGQAQSLNAPAALADQQPPNKAPLANHAVAWGS